jgi:hypothetical protein
MSSTQHQRAAGDLEAAGLNRILALGRPASSPAGAMAQVQNEEAALGAGLQSGINSALTARRLRQDIKQSEATIRLTNQQAVKTKAEANYVQSQDALAQANTRVALQERINKTLTAAGIQTANQIAELNRQIRSLEIPGVRSAAAFYEWLLSTPKANQDVHLSKVYGSSKLGIAQKWLTKLMFEGVPQIPTGSARQEWQRAREEAGR